MAPLPGHVGMSMAEVSKVEEDGGEMMDFKMRVKEEADGESGNRTGSFGFGAEGTCSSSSAEQKDGRRQVQLWSLKQSALMEP